MNEIIEFKLFIFTSNRYNNLNNVVINRGKLLQTAVHSLQLFDRSMDQVSFDKLFTLFSSLKS